MGISDCHTKTGVFDPMRLNLGVRSHSRTLSMNWRWVKDFTCIITMGVPVTNTIMYESSHDLLTNELKSSKLLILILETSFVNTDGAYNSLWFKHRTKWAQQYFPYLYILYLERKFLKHQINPSVLFICTLDCLCYVNDDLLHYL